MSKLETKLDRVMNVYDARLLPGAKAVYKQQIKDLFLEIIGEDLKLNDIYGNDSRNNYGYNETQVRDAARYLQRRLREKVNDL